MVSAALGAALTGLFAWRWARTCPGTAALAAAGVEATGDTATFLESVPDASQGISVSAAGTVGAAVQGTSMPAGAAIAEFSTEYPWIAAGAALVMVVWTLFVLAQLAIKYSPTPYRNYLPIHIFLVAAVGVVVPGQALASVAGAWLLMLAVRQSIYSLGKNYRFMEVLRAGLYLGTIPLLYAPMTPVVLFLAPLSMVIFKRSWRESTVCLAGLSIPVAAAGFLHWALGVVGVWPEVGAGFIYTELWRCCAGEFADGSVGAAGSTVFGWLAGLSVLAKTVVASMLVWSVFSAVRSMFNRKGARRRQTKFVAYLGLLLGLISISAAIPGANATVMPLLAVPMALFAPYSFVDRISSIISSAFYVVVLASVLVLNLL